MTKLSGKIERVYLNLALSSKLWSVSRTVTWIKENGLYGGCGKRAPYGNDD